ncbi:DUF2695 domain-containing protein [Saccharothrix variisporea]|uniref:Uncharacterized protein DUF2695 n=1 Tax=Saccharothrix variisporea TaxID=543527 RepID=A0A495XJ22_9PSEU|nr:DUF2695 domain-containing protein [Saccharothrix variisporea]RKT74077.1 uncharacterized protein DUF2695 [Saccharothrix variisporea]
MDARARKAAKAAYRQRRREEDWQALGLTPDQLADLKQFLEDHGVDECSDAFDLTRAWAADAGLDWGDVERGLRSQAAFCDCEVLTVDPDTSN